METNNSNTAPIITVVHAGGSNLTGDSERDITIVIEGEEVKIANEKSVEENRSTTDSKEQEHGYKDKDVQDDVDSVILEEVVTKTIDVDEDSGEELHLTIDQESGEVGNESFTKATEFVIVNAANISAIGVGDEAESTKRYAIEDIQIKDELAETITADLNSNDVLENDPMDLLELNTRSECTSSTRSQPDTEDYGDDGSSITSSSAQTGSVASVNVLDWIKEYPWLLYEEGDEMFGYCLYCDTNINVKSQRTVKQHGLSLYHKERCENYLAFREEEEKNGLSMNIIEIKEEFGTDSRVQALRLKRKSQSVALNNFNWRRWLEDYPWLVRNSDEGTTGYCKYCEMHVNVEFSYLRDRHQESGKHKECEKQYEESNESTSEQNKPPKPLEDKTKESSIDNNAGKRWSEQVENEPTMLRCKVCGTKMIKSNFPRHLKSNLHEHNEKVYLQNQKTAKQKKIEEDSDISQQSWKLYTKQHPWLVSDPSDSSFAYCKYCEKRIMYGSSAAKRATHENSSQHKQNESEFKKRSRKENTGKEQNVNTEKNGEESQNEENDDEDEEEDQESNEEKANDDNDEEAEVEDEDEETNEDENEVDNEEVEEDEDEQEKEREDNDSKKRIYRLSEEWINQYAWCRRYNKDPKNYIFCIYCKIPLSVTYSRSKHQTSSYHISAEKQFLERQSKKQERKKINETSPSSVYEWAIPLRNNPNSYSCRYCRVRISKNYSKKQHASSKIHQINENIYKNNRRKSTRKDDNSDSKKPTSETKKVVTQLANFSTATKVVIKAPSTVTLVKQWQKKFPWLTYKRTELRSNYGYCKLCDSSLFIRSLKHVLRHLRSPRHIAITKYKKKQKIENDVDENTNKDIKKGPKQELQTSPQLPNHSTSQNQINVSQTETESAKAITYKSTVIEMKKRFSWIEHSKRQNYVDCRFCNISIPLKVLFLRNHSNSLKHRNSVINYRSLDGNRDNQGQHTESENTGDVIKHRNDHGADNEEDDVMIVEENNEEILISEQDENWTIKSETMDEHEELDYLLQRSFNSQNQKKSNVCNTRKSMNTDENPPAKRMKRTQSFRRLNDSNTSLVASLLSTPLTLASCLGPLIQQQIQQQANISKTSQTNNQPMVAGATGIQTASTGTTPVEAENTYDLFFKSISETMKKLPVDLAAEGKLRVMQIICDLELQALRRQQGIQNESSSNNTSGGLSYQPTSTSTGTHAVGSNSSVIHDMTAEQSVNGSETIITQFNNPAEVSQQRRPSTTQIIPATSVNTSGMEKSSATSNDSSPIIGVMDKNGLQTIQLKTPVAKQIPRTISTNTNSTASASSVNGIRCIPFKNLSQTVSSDTSSNTKITRIQIPLNVATQSPNPNTTTVNSSKNLINYRNIQITKRINTPPATSTSSGSAKQQQQTASHTTAIMNKSPQRTYNITNIQPQLQRWGCSVNSTGSHQTPTSSGGNNLKQLSSQQTSPPISKRN